MASITQQLTAFGTDIVGLERTLRLIQATILVITSYAPLLHLTTTPPHALHHLQTRLNLTRRTVRLFWFLGSYQSGRESDGWPGVLARSALGSFGLLESATLLDLLGIEGVGFWAEDGAFVA
ncbi:AoPex11B-like protein [Ophiocordyceps camponoti-floridani]|uniref:AoPex11B-like protein n=1 Tax=Ophiocordyceps camponoti-floridani TaxID=2030778 RepID=A0A8H4QE22_9HYPO|nr:AoPex11B-like protein [Ophiocordyceps camponoti-floridani]